MLRFLPNAPRFLPKHRDSAKRATFSREKRRNPWESATIKFTRRHTFRDSVKVRCTQRDKHGARYAALISAAVAHLLPFLLRVQILADFACINFSGFAITSSIYLKCCDEFNTSRYNF